MRARWERDTSSSAADADLIGEAPARGRTRERHFVVVRPPSGPSTPGRSPGLHDLQRLAAAAPPHQGTRSQRPCHAAPGRCRSVDRRLFSPPMSVAQGGGERRVELDHGRRPGREAVGAVVHPGHHVELARHAGGLQAAGVLEVLLVEQVEVADADPRRRQAARGRRAAPGRRTAAGRRRQGCGRGRPARRRRWTSRSRGTCRAPRRRCAARCGRRASGTRAPGTRRRGRPRRGHAGPPRRPARRRRCHHRRRCGTGRGRARRPGRAATPGCPCSRRAPPDTGPRARGGSRRRRPRSRAPSPAGSPPRSTAPGCRRSARRRGSTAAPRSDGPAPRVGGRARGSAHRRAGPARGLDLDAVGGRQDGGPTLERPHRAKRAVAPERDRHPHHRDCAARVAPGPWRAVGGRAIGRRGRAGGDRGTADRATDGTGHDVPLGLVRRVGRRLRRRRRRSAHRSAGSRPGWGAAGRAGRRRRRDRTT